MGATISFYKILTTNFFSQHLKGVHAQTSVPPCVRKILNRVYQEPNSILGTRDPDRNE